MTNLLSQTGRFLVGVGTSKISLGILIGAAAYPLIQKNLKKLPVLKQFASDPIAQKAKPNGSYGNKRKRRTVSQN